MSTRPIKNWVNKHPLVNYWVPVILYAGLIFFLSSIPGTPLLEIEIPFLDKILHLLEYGIFGFLLWRGLSAHSPIVGQNKKIILWCIIIAMLYGLSDEIHQYFVPNRNCDMFDFTSDVVGASFAALFFQWRTCPPTFQWRRKQKNVS